MAMVSTPYLNNPFKPFAWIIVNYYYDYVDSLRYEQEWHAKPGVTADSFWRSQNVRYYS